MSKLKLMVEEIQQVLKKHDGYIEESCGYTGFHLKNNSEYDVFVEGVFYGDSEFEEE